MRKIFYIAILLLLVSCEAEERSRLELKNGIGIGTSASVTIYSTLYNRGDAAATDLIVEYTLKTDTDSLGFIEERKDTIYPGSFIDLYHLFEVKTVNFYGTIKVIKWRDL